MTRISLLALLASTTLGGAAFAADMAVKAPRPAAVPYTDWSGIYTGVAAGYAWGREKLTNDVGVINNLFGTGVERAFNGTPLVFAPDFDTGVCVIDSCNRLKMNGFIGGGFAGAQKQMGNWVIGIEGSWDWTSMKKSINVTTEELGAEVTRLLPTSTFQVGPLTVSAGGSLLIPGQNITSTGTLTIDAQTIKSNGTITINSQDIESTGKIIVGGQEIKSKGDLLIPGQLVNLCFNETCVPGKIDLPLDLGTISAEVPKQTVKVDVTGNTATATIDVVVNGKTEKLTIPVEVTGQTAKVTLPVTVEGKTVDKTVTVNVTGTTGTQNITIGLPREVLATANVTRSVELSSKLDQIVDIRGKIGLTNVFFGPNILLYATGGATIGHFQKTLALSQTVAVIGGGIRENTFTSSTGDTRLGWVLGAGLDWKLTQNVILGALYRHHEFPKGTVAFNDEGGQGRALSFGTSRASVDSIQGRLSVLFPID